MASDDISGLIYKLAERGFGNTIGGEGSKEGRSIALLLSAVDQLSMAAQIDPTLFEAVQKAIDELRQIVEQKSDTTTPPNETKKHGGGWGEEKEEGDEEGEETEEEEEDEKGKPSKAKKFGEIKNG